MVLYQDDFLSVEKPFHKYFISGALLKGLSHQIFKSFLSSTILNQYFLYGRWWFRFFFIQGIILIFKDEVLTLIRAAGVVYDFRNFEQV